ncbi:unnamed protein product [Ixodes persulcatus]
MHCAKYFLQNLLVEGKKKAPVCSTETSPYQTCLSPIVFAQLPNHATALPPTPFPADLAPVNVAPGIGTLQSRSQTAKAHPQSFHDAHDAHTLGGERGVQLGDSYRTSSFPRPGSALVAALAVGCRCPTPPRFHRACSRAGRQPGSSPLQGRSRAPAELMAVRSQSAGRLRGSRRQQPRPTGRFFLPAVADARIFVL